MMININHPNRPAQTLAKTVNPLAMRRGETVNLSQLVAKASK